ncbi:IPT/TIG domain-containing protein [Niabella beijingensis]|uniref:IPT/TIG domain-containing protein n=1 Tax=Niabella beijingensis TaxID=2872700 RepID=UPI001CBF2BC6|nr:IPT/TIG domain-containing protein [Niabella beijingensis]MBZ4190600.1 IPT/TIG domain-containing protein [Niabella beijingensis]
MRKKWILYVIAGYLLTGLLYACKKDKNAGPSGPVSIERFTPEQGGGRTELLITGTGFSSDTAQLSVTINGRPLKIIGANERQIMAIVPKKIGSGPVVITVNGQSATSTASFTYQFNRIVTTFAGSGVYGFANGKGADAQFYFSDPANAWYRSMGVVADRALNVYVADPGNHCIRKIDSSGNVTLFAGAPGVSGYADGKGNTARFSLPYGLALDADDNLYCVDPGNWDIRKITPDGTATTLGFAPGAPWGIAVNKTTGIIYYTCTDAGSIHSLPVAGGGSATVAEGLSYPAGIAADKSGNLYVSVSGEHVIRKLAAGTWASSIIAGTKDVAGYANGAGDKAKFSYPWGLAIDADGNLYVGTNGTWNGDPSVGDQSVRMIKAGTWEVDPFAGGNVSGFMNAIGTGAKFSAPIGVGVDKYGTVYVLDKNNNVVRKIVSE